MKAILKKLTAYLLTLAMLITLVPMTALPVLAEDEQTELWGAGTETDPYLIRSLYDLEALRDGVNGGEAYAGRYFRLEYDIDMSETYGEGKLSWTPIGGVANAASERSIFEGSFDGGGHTISGLYIQSGDAYQGLFGYISKSGTVKNVTVSGKVIVNNEKVGLVVGYNLGTILNVRASGSADGTNSVGLIAGKNGADVYYMDETQKAKIESSYADGTVNGYHQVGLIAGLNKSLISKCSTSGTFSLDNLDNIGSTGGICGENSGDNAVVEHSYNAARCVDNTNNTQICVGGISGQNIDGAKISYCYNTVTITAYNAAGIACLNYLGTITQCYQYGRTTGTVGTMGTGYEGEVNPIAKNKSGTEEIGNVIESYYYEDHNNGEYPNESGNPIGGLSYQDELLNWDFETVWKMDAILGRPFLRNNLERGSADKPHEITGNDELRSLSRAVNNGNTYEGEYIKLTTDIRYDYRYRGNWTPIGTYDAESESNSKPFKGNFDGEGHLIFEWCINAPENDYQGLFGYTDGATVKNLRVNGELTGKNYVGMIVAYGKNSTIENVAAQGSVAGKQYVGGVAGKIETGTIQRSQNRAAISAEEYVGGIAGFINGDMSISFNMADVNGTNYVGGMIGLCDGGWLGIRNVYNTGNVTATGAVAGGICGGLKSSEITKVYNLGEVNQLGDTHGVIYGEKKIGKATSAYSLAGTQYGVNQLTAEQFKKQESFGSFDFKNTWAMSPYLGRPVLRSCKEYAGGAEDGTAENPYTVNNLDDLEAFRDSVNGGETYEGKYVKLTADIDLSEKYGADIDGQEVSWTAIGDYVCSPEKPFNGVFDGDHHKITGLYIKGGNNKALFGYLGGDGTVKNLTVSGEITDTSGSGIVVSMNKGTIKNVSASGNVSGSQNVGGICGDNYGTIENCSNAAAVNTNAENVGGICGDNNGSIKNCYNTGSVTGSTNVGGICGKNSSYRGSMIKSCYNAAPIIGNETVGGVCGLNGTSTDSCYNVGEVTAINNMAGGICGYTDSGLSNCYNYANVISNGKKAGICAFVYSRTTPANNYYNGDAFDGDAYINEENEASRDGRLSEADFADQTKFTGFDFENTWVMYEKAGRPMLKGMEEPDGTEYNPLKIRTLADLEEFSASVNGGNNYTDKKVFLLADIDMSEKYGKGKKSWTPIGHYLDRYDHSTWFNGTFEGGGHKITGLYIEGDAENQGLFGVANELSVIRDLTVSGDVSGENSVGLLVGWNIGVIENVTAYGSVNGISWVGGIVGYNDMSSSYIKQCTNFATVSGEDNVGGIVGRAATSIVRECRNMGTIYASNYYAGGISGNWGTIQNCYNTAPVSAENYGAGGIAGTGYEIQNCYNIGSVSAGNEAGGIAGFDGSAENCYNIGRVSADTKAGGIVGYDGTAENCYHTTDADNGIGTAVTEEALAAQNTFATWDFDTVWRMNPLLGRPVLRSNVEGESGTESDPYVIDSLEKLESFRDSVNRGTSYAGEFVTLTADIDLSEKYNANNQWTPIGIKGTSGNPDKPFSGSFDGNGHRISGLYINDISKSYQGLFGNVSGGSIQKLAVTDAVVVANRYFAGIVAYMTGGTIENCYYTGKLGANDGVYGYYGAIAGEIENESTLKNCYANAQIPDYSPYDSWGGGVIAGIVYCSQVASCYFNSTGNENRIAIGRSPQSTVDSYTGGKTVEELADQNTYNDWDFENVWTMHPILGLPTFAGGGFSGEGTENNPYIISTLEDLEILASAVNGGNNFEKTYFALGSDIDMAGKYNAETGKSWTPIGSSRDTAFSGVFDGRNHTVTGLSITDRTDDYTGLFGYIIYKNWYEEGETYKATIKNLSVSGSITGNGRYTGGLVGSINNGALVENCGVKVDITSASGIYCVGGLAGESYGSIKNSFASGHISAKGTVGGLVGSNSYATIQNCYSLGSVTGEENVGGLSGYFEGETIVNSYSLANVTGGKPLLGGGWGTVKNCYYTGNANDAFEESVKKTKAQFESGEVAYLLSRGCTISDDYFGDTTYDGSVWKQTIGKDASPGFTGLKVYATTGCVTYNNTGDTSRKEHNAGSDGTCADCGEYRGAALVDGVYQIYNEKDLRWFAELVSGGEASANAILKDDIRLNESLFDSDGNLDAARTAEFTAFMPIGNSKTPYDGTFDGNGHTVSGLFFQNAEEAYVGLFGVTGENAVIQNLKITASYVEAKQYIGLFAGKNNGTIKDCTANGTVISSSSDYNGGMVGGMVGENNGTIFGDKYNPIEFSGKVLVRGNGDYIGGIAGSNMGSIRYAQNSGFVNDDTAHDCVGGIVGVNGSYSGKATAVVENCTNIGDVKGNFYVGGICGANFADATVKSCVNSFAKDKSVCANSFVGGLVGSNSGFLSQCINEKDAAVTALSETSGFAGGIVGYNDRYVSDCINYSNAITASQAGGIGGNNAYEGTMKYCANFVESSPLGVCDETSKADAVKTCYYILPDSGLYPYGLGVPDEDVKSGFLAYVLQDGREEQIWGQEIGRDLTPTLRADQSVQVFKVRFTAVNGITEKYYNYYALAVPPATSGFWTMDGKLVGGISVTSDMEMKEVMYLFVASNANLSVYAQKGTYALVIAGYDENGRLVETETTMLTFAEAGGQNLSIQVSGATAKVFLVESLESMKPVCEAAKTDLT